MRYNVYVTKSDHGGTMGERWPTIAEIAERTGYNVGHLRRLIRAGRIAASKVGQTYLVNPASFAAYYDSVKDKPQGGPR